MLRRSPQRIRDGLVGEAAPLLATAPQRRHAASGQLPHQLFNEARLADAGGALHDDRGRLPTVAHLAPHTQDGGLLRHAAEEDLPGHITCPPTDRLRHERRRIHGGLDADLRRQHGGQVGPAAAAAGRPAAR